MFDLEKAIAEWRRQSLAAGIQRPEPLGELETHLRDEIERLRRSGLQEETAFDMAIQQLGQPRLLGTEFRKNGQPARKIWGMVTAAACLVIILRVLYVHFSTGDAWKGDQFGWLVFSGIVLFWTSARLFLDFSLGQTREVRVWKLAAIFYSSVAVWATMVQTLQILSVPRFGHAVGIGCRVLILAAMAAGFLSCFGWWFFRNFIPVIPGFAKRSMLGVGGCVVGSGLVSLFFWFSAPLGNMPLPLACVLLSWGYTTMAVLAGVGYGLAEAADGRNHNYGN